MKLELLYETRQSIAAKDVNLVYYLQEIERRLSAGEEAVKKIAELKSDKRELVDALERIVAYLRTIGIGTLVTIPLGALITKHKEVAPKS